MNAMTILDPDGVPLSLTEGEIARAFNKALAALTAADALADAVEAVSNSAARWHLVAALDAAAAYREARK